MFNVGDIVVMYAPTAGKKKYHLCVCEVNEHGVEFFLFINSGSGYAADFVVNDGSIDCLPESPTGNTVVSCSVVIRANQKQLAVYRAKKIGTLSKKISASSLN